MERRLDPPQQCAHHCDAPRHLRLSRRGFLALASLLLGCHTRHISPLAQPAASFPSPTPAVRPRSERPSRPARNPTLTVNVPDLPSTLAQQARRWLARLEQELPQHWTLRVTASPDALFHLRTSIGTPSGHPIGGRVFVPVTTHENLVRNLTADGLRALLAGTIDNWRDLGHPDDLPILRVSIEDDGCRLATAEQQVPNVFSLTEIADHGLFALVEPDSTVATLRILSIEGNDLFRSPPVALQVPELVEWLVLEGPTHLLSLDALPPEPLPQPNFTSLTVVGDVIFGRTVHRIMVQRKDWQAPFRAVADELSWADLTIANLECALTRRYAPPEDPRTLRFLSFPEAIAGLQLAGIDAVSLANNHSMDFGWQALQDTKDALAQVGIVSFGAGANVESALEPAILCAGTVTVALLGFDGISTEWYGATNHSPGTAPLRPELVQKAISAAANRAAIVIPYFHWGVEYTLVPTTFQRQIARLAIDSGATLVVGSHPHWVQGVEWYRDRPIFYSLGNFVFDQEWSRETKQGLILHLWFRNSDLVRYDLVPVLIEDYHRPRIATPEEATVILRRVQASTRALRS